MSIQVGIRSLDNLVRLQMPEECRKNSAVLRELLQFAPRVLPEFSTLTEDEVASLADAVAYAMRTDLVLRGTSCWQGMFQPGGPTIQPRYGEDGLRAHLRNSPDVLNSGWRMPRDVPDEVVYRGAELFRCYAYAIQFMPGLKEKLGGSYQAAFPLADLTAYLLNPRDLVDYTYTREELDRFRESLARDLSEI
ncbi:hypothetical protein HY490_03450 [Candidatus Woesearchaeota archaeon]|nr:hypothetical protein [Candidatus Woesearchaeota archaeon]